MTAATVTAATVTAATVTAATVTAAMVRALIENKQQSAAFPSHESFGETACQVIQKAKLQCNLCNVLYVCIQYCTVFQNILDVLDKYWIYIKMSSLI